MTVPHHSEPAREAVRSAPLLKDGDVVERLKQFRLRWQEDGDLTYLGKALVDAIVEIEGLRVSASPAPAAGGLEAVQNLIDKTEKLIEAADDMGWSCNSSSADQAIREAKEAVRAALASPAATRGEAGIKAGLDAAAEYLLACDDYGDRHKAGEIRKLAPPAPAVESAQVKEGRSDA